jgi:hypothetical protein
MSLESLITDLTAAVNALTAEIKSGKSGGTSAPAGKPAAAGKPPSATAKGPKNTVETVAEMAARVKSELGKEAAVWLIANKGGAEKLAQMKPAKFDEFVAACQAALEAGEVAEMAEAAEDEI